MKQLPSLAYQPFGFAGKRKCPGWRFSIVEGLVFLSVLIKRFKFHLVEGQQVNPVHGLVTSPAEEVWITVTRRGVVMGTNGKNRTHLCWGEPLLSLPSFSEIRRCDLILKYDKVMRIYSAHNLSHSLMAFYNSSVGRDRPPHRGRPLRLFVVWTREIPLWCTVTFQLRQPGFNQYLIKIFRNFDCRWKFWRSSRFFFRRQSRKI